MFDRLDDILVRYQQVLEELNDPDVVNDQSRFRKLMKEQTDLTPIAEKYTEYKQTKQNIEDSLEMIETESDEEMKELAREELAESKARLEEIENELKMTSTEPALCTSAPTTGFRIPVIARATAMKVKRIANVRFTRGNAYLRSNV
mgnify:CR=1 FL=1